MNYSLLCEQYRSSQPLSRTSPNEIYLKKNGWHWVSSMQKNYPTTAYFSPCLEAKYFCCFRKKNTMVLWNTLVLKIGALVSIMQPNDWIQNSQNIGIGKKHKIGVHVTSNSNLISMQHRKNTGTRREREAHRKV